LILEKLERNTYPSIKELHRFVLGHGIEVTQRTIERDIEKLRYEFGVSIISDDEDHRYYIDIENSRNYQNLLNLIEIAVTADVFGEPSKEKENLEYISFEHQGSLKGINQLKPILQAIKGNRKITFNHYNFHSNKTKRYTIKPYLLKEYLGRWYVVGLIGPLKEFRTFGIERIIDLEMQTAQFTRNSDLDPVRDFRHIIGLTYSLGQREKVVLSFTPTQGQYIKSLPLHSSQKELIDNKEEYRIELDIIPNFELKHRVLSYGDTVKVLEPESLVQELMETIERMREKYK
jgi:predicted DNA-binding transcriptional regulator YafY